MNMFKMPSPPAPIPPPPMPDPYGPAANEASNIAIQKAMTGGRSSTILTTAASRAGAGTIAAGGAGVPYAGVRLSGSS